jgi:telomere length regulation protein
MVNMILRTLVDDGQVELFTKMVFRLKSFEQRKYINAAVSFVGRQCFQSDIITKEDAPIHTSQIISGAACLLESIVKDSDLLKEHLVSSLTRPSIPALDESLAVRRSVLAVLALDEGEQDPHTRRTILTNYRKTAHASGELYKAVW